MKTELWKFSDNLHEIPACAAAHWFIMNKQNLHSTDFIVEIFEVPQWDQKEMFQIRVSVYGWKINFPDFDDNRMFWEVNAWFQETYGDWHTDILMIEIH